MTEDDRLRKFENAIDVAEQALLKAESALKGRLLLTKRQVIMMSAFWLLMGDIGGWASHELWRL